VVDRYKSLAPRICCVTCVRLLTECVNGRCNRDNLQTQTHSEVYIFVICNESFPHSAELPPKLPENLTFSNDNSDYDDDRRQQEGKMFNAIRHLKQVVSHLNPIYEHNEILTNFFVI
jgi:hypothetical protein